MIELTSPTSTATIHVPDEAVEKYEAQGWKRAARPSSPRPRQKRTTDS